jgi:NitT/TauT family transport system substrate-binding protein
MCLQQDLRDTGVDPDKLERISDRTMARNYEALVARDIDIIQACEPFISMAEKDRTGEILYAASTRGPTTYTAFIATRDACAKNRQELAAMVRATVKMLAWVYANPSEDLAKVVSEFFPKIPTDILVQSLKRYKNAVLWSRETRMFRQGFTQLARSLHSGGFVARVPIYEECVEPNLNDIG